MIARTIQQKIENLASKFPVVTLTGPRQSGKSTLLRHAFPDYQYVSLENLDVRTFATEDPHGFLKTYPRHVIIDEAQRVPTLFSYIQTHVDEVDEPGLYILSGSHNFLLMETVNQSLAGRTAILKLLRRSQEAFCPPPLTRRFSMEAIHVYSIKISPQPIIIPSTCRPMWSAM